MIQYTVDFTVIGEEREGTKMKAIVKKYSRLIICIASVIVAILLLGTVINSAGKSKADDITEEPVKVTAKSDDNHISPGYVGIIEAVKIVEASSSPYNALGTSGEDVLVGQRRANRELEAFTDVGEQVKESVDEIDEQSWKLAKQTKMSDGDYETLLAIVEAESGGEDTNGRIMVANVILNRVNHENFPDNVTDVVWQRVGGAPQFSPTYDGRISTVKVSDVTREAVNRAIDGEDLSQGALFFMGKATAEEHNKRWFNGNLKFLFEHGVHSFYEY